MTEPAAVALFRERREQVLGRIAVAAARAGRDAESVTLVAVSKTVDAGRVQSAVDAGFTLLGENRVQEGVAKAPLVAGARWHLIGPLQSNKARRAIEVFETIETVDSVDLAARLDRLAGEIGRQLGVFLQVNVDRDPKKAGFAPEEIVPAVPGILGLPNLRVLGLMTVGRLVSDPEQARPTFRALRALSERLRASEPGLGAGLSMGMTEDFEVAIEEGATLVRIGRAIFGERPTA